MVSMKSILLGVLSTATAAAAYESDWVQLNGVLIQVSFDGRRLCGVNAASNIFCATDNLDSNPNWRQIPGGLKWVAVWGDHLWGVNAGDNIYYGRSSGDPQWRQLPGKLKQISADGKQLCGANANNDVFCADDGITSTPNWRQLPGKFKQVDVSDGTIYGVAPDDSVWFGMSDGEPSFTKIVGGLKSVAYDGELLCGLNPSGDIYCATDGLKTKPNWRQIPGKLKQLDVQAGRIYGVNAGNNIFHKWLTQPPSMWAGWRQINGKLRQLNFDGKSVCGVNTADDIFCATEGFEGNPNWRHVPGKLIHVVVWGDFLWGVNRHNTIYYGKSSGAPQWRQLPGKLKQISTDGKQICGANGADEIWCADSLIDSKPNWRKLPGALKHVVVLNGVLFGVNKNNVIYTGRSKGNDPMWVQISGSLKNLEYDGIRLCGTNTADEIWCADSGLHQGKPNWQRIDGKLSYASVNANRLMGVNANSNIFSRMDM